MPFPNARIIPEQWSAHHRPAMPTAMNAVVTVGQNLGPIYNALTDDTTTTWSDEYTGPALIQETGGTAPTTVAGQPLTGHGYLVQLPYPASGLKPGMRVLVTLAPNDVDLAGGVLWIIDRAQGSEQWTRNVTCSDSYADVRR